MDQVGRDGLYFLAKGWRGEGAFDIACLTVSSGFLGFDHDFEGMVAVLGGDDRSLAFLDAIDHVAQSVGPGPGRVGFFEDLPCADIVLPHFIAVRIPVLADHLNGAGRAVELDAGNTVFLDREAGGDDGKDTFAKDDRTRHTCPSCPSW